MKKLFLIAPLILAASLLSGCMGLASTVTALSRDNANIDMEIATIYGTAKFHRSMGTNYILTTPVPAPVAPAK